MCQMEIMSIVISDKMCQTHDLVSTDVSSLTVLSSEDDHSLRSHHQSSLTSPSDYWWEITSHLWRFDHQIMPSLSMEDHVTSHCQKEIIADIRWRDHPHVSLSEECSITSHCQKKIHDLISTNVSSLTVRSSDRQEVPSIIRRDHRW